MLEHPPDFKVPCSTKGSVSIFTDLWLKGTLCLAR